MTDAVAIEIGDDYVATIELRRPPNNLRLRGNDASMFVKC